MMRRIAASALLGLTMALAPMSAMAETFNVPMTGQNRGNVAGLDRFVIPTYHLNFITSQQATAAASIMSRVRLAMVLVGPDQAMMRRLTNEAYIDLRAQMEAAGLTLVSPEDARTMVVAAGYEDIPGNIQLTGIGPSLTIGAGVRSGWATFGPDAAPALTAFRMPRNTMESALSIQSGNRMNGQLGQAGAIMVAPQLTLDFVAMNASAGRGIFGSGAASASGRPGVAIRATSQVNVHKPASRGPGTPGALRPRADVISAAPFAEVVQGGAAVRTSATLSDIADENYQSIQRARGDAVVADVAVWEGLIRDAYRGYNAGIVAAIVSQRR